MSSPLSAQLSRYAGLFELTAQSMNGQKAKPHFGRQKAALDQLMEMGFPTRKSENWKYTPALPILQKGKEVAGQTDIESILTSIDLPELDAYKVIVANGVIDWNLSDDLSSRSALTVTPIHEYGDQQRLESIFADEIDPFALLNRAFSADSVVFDLPAGARLNKPLVFIHIQSGGQAKFVNGHRVFIAGANSEATVVDIYPDALAKQSFVNLGTHISVGANAHFHHYRLQYDKQQNDYVNNVRIFQEADSTYSSYAIDTGGKTVRNNLYAYHRGTQITTNYYGVYFASERQHIDNQTFIDHAIPHCQSNELYKGILDDRGTGVFNGKVLVRKDAQKTNAYQQNSSLVLSPNATMNTKPQLEIYADDVRCSHGATIGQLDESSLYYLRSRGLTAEQARRMLQIAFLGEVLGLFKHDDLRNFATGIIESKMG